MPVSVVVPVPICCSEPVPETTPAKVMLSERSKVRIALSETFPVIDPDVAPLPICSVPAEIVVPPL